MRDNYNERALVGKIDNQKRKAAKMTSYTPDCRNCRFAVKQATGEVYCAKKQWVVNPFYRSVKEFMDIPRLHASICAWFDNMSVR